MAPFWQNQPETPDHRNHKNTLETIIYGESSCNYTKTKIEQADAPNSQNEPEEAYKM
jgi:hypothetical protein